MIGIVDYGMGNLHSILKALHRIGEEATIIHRPEQILSATKIILPGVGHFNNGMDRLHNLGFVMPLRQRAMQDKIPVLGICLGAQLLTDHSEEGDAEGLGLIPGDTLKFDFTTANRNLKIPHMGWNQITSALSLGLFEGLTNASCFYFVHSYYIRCKHASHAIGSTTYGLDFHSIIRKENIIGMQFHPEKSHADGLRLLKNFANQS